MTYLAARRLPGTLWMLLDVLLASTTGMPGAYELDVFLEARGVGAGAMGIPLDEFDRMRLLFLSAPRLKVGQACKREVVA